MILQDGCFQCIRMNNVVFGSSEIVAQEPALDLIQGARRTQSPASKKGASFI